MNCGYERTRPPAYRAILGHASMSLVLKMQTVNHSRFEEFSSLVNPPNFSELSEREKAELDRQVLKKACREEPDLFWEVMKEVPDAVDLLDIEEDLGLATGTLE